MTDTPARRLRALLAGPDLVQAPGAYDAITARLIEQAGFPAVYMTGAGTSAAQGFPDYGLLTLTEMAANAGLIARAVGLPVISDADTGYGNELNVTRTVREFEARGVAAIHIEDQVSPKRCGHLDGKAVIGLDEFASKIRAAAAARRDPDFLIIARTDANAVTGFEDAIARANAGLAAGADLAFVEAPKTLAEAAAIPQRVNGPCLLNVVPGGRTPRIAPDEARAMGFRLAIYPGACLGPVLVAVDAALARLKGETPAEGAKGGTPEDLFRRFGADEWDALRRRLDTEAKDLEVAR